MRQETIEKARDPVCRRCAYRGMTGSCSTCDYILMEGHRRPKRVDGVCPVFTPKGKGANRFARQPFIAWRRAGDGKGSRALPQSPTATAPSKREPKGGETAAGQKGARGKLDRERALELYRQGRSDAEIAGELWVHQTTVSNWRRREGLPAVGRWGHPVWLDGEAALKLYRQGMSDGQIGEKLGLSKGTVRRWRGKEGLPANTCDGKPARVDGEAAMALYRQGLNDRQMGEKLGCHKETVRRWRSRNGLPVNRRGQHGQERAGGDDGPAAVR